MTDIVEILLAGRSWEMEAAHEIEQLREAIRDLLACPSGIYCDAYPEAEKRARALLAKNSNERNEA